MEIATEYEKQNQLLQSMQLQIEANKKLQKELHNTIIRLVPQELKGNIRVLCRVRSLLPNETGAISFPKNEENIGRGVVVSHSDIVANVEPNHREGEKCKLNIKYCKLAQVYIFAYGQSGSGKMNTMMGNPGNGEKGLIPMSLEQIFQTSKALNSNGWKYVSKMVDIYNDTIYDLLGGNSTSNLTTIIMFYVNEVFHHLKQSSKKRLYSSFQFLFLYPFKALQ
uniref:Kinesin motor domain-containing protein n=1 Tax=Oryza punctata TaxID=4537 RepID=A0A0E0MAT4_ORYPU